jgi:hypothetical protein
MRHYKLVDQNPFGVKKNWHGKSVNIWSCLYQRNTPRSCNINLIHCYQDVIHQHRHSSLLSVFYQQYSMYRCGLYADTVCHVSVRNVFWKHCYITLLYQLKYFHFACKSHYMLTVIKWRRPQPSWCWERRGYSNLCGQFLSDNVNMGSSPKWTAWAYPLQ